MKTEKEGVGMTVQKWKGKGEEKLGFKCVSVGLMMELNRLVSNSPK